MAYKLKVVTIGGGSSYTPEIIEGFIKRHQQLPITEIWLVDIEEGRKKLEIVGALAERMVAKAAINCKIYLSYNRQEALAGADFVTTQFRVGQLEARIKDERLPLSMGMLGQETNGLGGFAKALRTIPVILDICADMERLCPNAWLINFTNPSGMVTEAVLRFTKIRCMGLCNVPLGMRKAIEEVLGSNDFIFHAQGLNHYLWGTHVYFNGQDVLPKILPQLLTLQSYNPKNIEDVPWPTEHILASGMMPSPYHRYYYMHDDMLQHQLVEYSKNNTRAEFTKGVEENLFKLYQDINLAEKPLELAQRGGAYYSDAACELISAIYNNSQELMIVNIQNNGTIESIPHDAVIEATALITSAGAIPLKSSSLDFTSQSEIAILKAFERLTIEAAMTGSYATALRALSINPLVKKGSQLTTALNKLLLQNKVYLKNWDL